MSMSPADQSQRPAARSRAARSPVSRVVAHAAPCSANAALSNVATHPPLAAAAPSAPGKRLLTSRLSVAHEHPGATRPAVGRNRLPVAARGCWTVAGRAHVAEAPTPSEVGATKDAKRKGAARSAPPWRALANLWHMPTTNRRQTSTRRDPIGNPNRRRAKANSHSSPAPRTKVWQEPTKRAAPPAFCRRRAAPFERARHNIEAPRSGAGARAHLLSA